MTTEGRTHNEPGPAREATQADAWRLLSTNYTSLCEQANLAVGCATELCVLWGNGDEGRWGGGGGVVGFWEGFLLRCVRLKGLTGGSASKPTRQTSALRHVWLRVNFWDLEKIGESVSICFLSLFPGESKGKTFPAVPPDWVWLT